MTKTRTNGECPICGKVLQMVAKHLRETHLIKNVKERAILNSMATGRTVIPPGPCPIQGCSPAMINVDTHLKAHKELTYEQIAEERRKAKRAAAIKALAALRASSPDPLMQTRLDLADPGEAASEEEPCQTCRTSKVKIRNLTAQVKRLKRQVADLKSSAAAAPAKEEVEAPAAAAAAEEVGRDPAAVLGGLEEPQQQPLKSGWGFIFQTFSLCVFVFYLFKNRQYGGPSTLRPCARSRQYGGPSTLRPCARSRQYGGPSTLRPCARSRQYVGPSVTVCLPPHQRQMP
ncbi:hypothetical protein GBF38_016614 [Nibea albiflora]|uniref:Uncharacterized protein n=1 Tax=Nibea albiflora TaxID=240163 RepID=A0ACB7ERA0_NIBAL|nr:hypothetical protein GBF38_016614 [Nibea albiflora]